MTDQTEELVRALGRVQSWIVDYSEGRLDATLVIPAIAREVNEALGEQNGND